MMPFASRELVKGLLESIPEVAQKVHGETVNYIKPVYGTRIGKNINIVSNDFRNYTYEESIFPAPLSSIKAVDVILAATRSKHRMMPRIGKLKKK